MKFLVLFFLTLIITGCAGSESKSQINRNTLDTTFEVTRDRYGDTIFLKTKVNGVSNGEFKSYYGKGKLWSKAFYKNGKLEGEQLLYTEEGNLAEQNFWENSRLKTSIIFWQYIPFTNNKKFYFISDTGIYKIQNGKPTYSIDSNPPEGFILDNIYSPEGVPIYYVFKNGKFELWPNPRMKN